MIKGVNKIGLRSFFATTWKMKTLQPPIYSIYFNYFTDLWAAAQVFDEVPNQSAAHRLINHVQSARVQRHDRTRPVVRYCEYIRLENRSTPFLY